MKNTIKNVGFALLVAGTAFLCQSNQAHAQCVGDLVAPEVDCQDNIVVALDGNGIGVVTLEEVLVSVTDNCTDPANVLDVQLVGTTTFDCTDVGVLGLSVMIQATDVQGNSNFCSTAITVIDNVAPTSLCQNITVALDATGNYALTVAEVDNGSYDACGLATQSIAPAAFDCTNVGENVVTLTNTDVNGNTSTCDAIVSVIDDQAPVITCPADGIFNTDAGLCDFTIAAPTAPTVVENCTYDVSYEVSGATSASGMNDINGVTFQTGVSYVLWTVEDASGNMDFCTQTITVVDTELPTIVCPADVVVSNDPGMCSAVVNGIDPIASDNCDFEVTYELSGTTSGSGVGSASGVEFNLGDFGEPAFVTYTVTDASGNSASCTMQVTVNDDEAPIAVCPTTPAIFAIGDDGSVTVNLADLDLSGFTDNCQTWAIDPFPDPVFDCTELGDTTLDIYIRDFGQFAFCSYPITIIDEIAPNVVCPPDVNAITDAGLCTATVDEINFNTLQYDDNCETEGQLEINWSTTGATTLSGSVDFSGGSLVGVNWPSGPFNIGTTTVMFEVIDDSGNSATCSMDVTVADAEAPMANCVAPFTIALDASGNASITALQVDNGSTDNCDNDLDLSIDVSTFSCADLGPNTVVLTVVDDAGNSATCNAVVTVEDNLAPSIECSTDLARTTSEDGITGDCFYVADADDFLPTVDDNCSVVSTTHDYVAAPNDTDLDGASFEVGSHTIVWTTEDQSGNTSSCSITVVVTDDEAPSFTYCPDDIMVNTPLTDCNQIVAITPPNYSDLADNCGVALLEGPVFSSPFVHTISQSNSNYIAEFPEGTTTVTYTVTDVNGNTTECAFDVVVEDDVDPTISCPGDQALTVDLNCIADPVLPDFIGNATADDNCSSSTITQVPAPNTALSVILGAAPQNGNTITVTITVDDGNGQSDDCSFVLTLEDNVGPYINCPADQEVFTGNGNVTCQTTLPDFTSDAIYGVLCNSVNPSLISISQSPAAGTVMTADQAVTLTVDDGQGNTTDCTFNAIFVDNTVPFIVDCPDNPDSLQVFDQCEGEVTVTLPTYGDNCSTDITVTGVRSDGGTVDASSLTQTFPVGITTIEWTADDNNGNATEAGTCITTVTVLESVTPVASCQSNSPIVLNSNGEAMVLPTNLDNGSYDNCDCGIAAYRVEYLASDNDPSMPMVIDNTVTCDHVGLNPQFRLYVEDCSGNESYCITGVVVSDFFVPLLTQPDPITISCEFAPGDPGAVIAANVPVDFSLNPADFIFQDAATGITGYPFAQDNCGAEISYSDVSTQGTDDTDCSFYNYSITRTWTAVDPSGNMISKDQLITVEDATAPEFDQDPGDLTAIIDCNDPNFDLLVDNALALAPTATDNCATPIVQLVSDVTEDDVNCVDGYAQTRTRVFRAYDPCGNETFYEQKIYIEDDTAPALTCPNNGNDIMADLDANCEYTDTFEVEVTDCFLFETTWMIMDVATNATLASDSGSMVTYTFNGPGIYIVGFEATDYCGNTDMCMTTITLEDNTAPELDCAALIDLTVNSDAGLCEANVAVAHPMYIENCGASMILDITGAFADENAISTFSALPGDPAAYAFPVGTSTLTYTVTDESGNEATCSYTVTVEDNEPPLLGAAASPFFPCPDNQVGTTGENTIGDCAKEINWKHPAVSDNCGEYTLSVEYAAGVPAPENIPTGGEVNAISSVTQSFEKGETFVNYTVVDAAGNTSVCGFSVVITDDEDPNVFCQNYTAILDANGMATITADDIDAGSFDNCDDAPTRTLSVDSFSCDADLGPNTVTLTVTDEDGNSASCDAVVTVVDNMAPTVDCGAPVKMRNTSDDEADITDQAATDCDYVASAGEFDPVDFGDNCTFTLTHDFADAPSNTTLDGAIFYEADSPYSITWTIVDSSGLEDECTITIEITDDENPIFNYCPADIMSPNTTGTCGQVKQWAEPMMDDLFDNCGIASLSMPMSSNATVMINRFLDGAGQMQASAQFPVGTTTVSYIATDINGNSTTCSFDVVISDMDLPTIACPATQVLNIDLNCNIAEATMPDFRGLSTADDNCSNVTISQVPAPGTLLTDSVGMNPMNGADFTVELTVDDGNGNTADCSFMVVLNDNAGPFIVCPGDQMIPTSTGTGLCDATLPDLTLLVQAGNNCGTNGDDVTLTQDPAAGTVISAATIVTLTATDDNDNETSCTIIADVIDDTAPEFTFCPGDVTTSTTSCVAFVGIANATASDNCMPFALVSAERSDLQPMGMPFPAGVTTITWTAEDLEGNSATCETVVTVTETGLPFADCYGTVNVALDQDGINIVTPNQIDDSSYDLCCEISNRWIEFADPSIVDNTVTCEHVGQSLTVTLFVEDCNGNVNSCTATVMVQDTLVPEITDCPADQTSVPNDLDFCGAEILLTDLEAEDNCSLVYEYSTDGGTTWTEGANASGYYEVGTTTIDWRVTDPGGNTDTCQTIIEVEDVQAPQADCVDGSFTSSQDALGLYDCGYTINGTEVDVISSDNCEVATVTNDYNLAASLDGETFPVGSTMVLWTVTDIHGLVSTCTSTVTVTDDEAPMIACVDGTFTTSQDGLDLYDCGYTVSGSELDPTVEDNCVVSSVVNDYNGDETLAGAVFPKGSTIVNWTVTDEAGLTATCTTTVDVADDEDPEITCVASPQARNTSADGGYNCNYVATGGEFDATFADNCPGAVVSNDLNGTATVDGEAFETGTTTVTWTSTDEAGNTATCSVDIVVTDDENPICDSPADMVISTSDNTNNYDCGVFVTVPELVFEDNCAVMMVVNDSDFADASAEDASGVYPVGTTTITWVVLDVNGNSSTCSTTVTVEDDEAPLLTCFDAVVQSNDAGICGAEVTGLITQSDENCDVDRIEWSIDYADGTTATGTTTGQADTHVADVSGLYPVGISTASFTVYDIYGNTLVCESTVTVNDTEAPAIECLANLSQSADLNSCETSVDAALISATDNCEIATITNDYNNTADATDVYPVGTTTVTYTVTDIYGNVSICSFDVTVTDDQAPVLDCLEDFEIAAHSGACFFVAPNNVWDPVVTFECSEPVTFAHDYAAAPDNTTLGGAQFEKGTTLVTWTVTDAAGNVATCSTAITVVDTQVPTIECAPDQTFTTSQGPNPLDYDCGFTMGGTGLDPLSWDDNCPMAVLTNDYNSSESLAGETFPIGTTEVMWTVTDMAGNTASCTVSVTVEDDEAPTVLCINDIAVGLDETGSLVLDAAYAEEFIDQGSFDNCDGALTYELNQYSFDCSHLGSNTLILTVTDEAGNSNTCETTFEVQDNLAPVAVCQNITVTTDGIVPAVIDAADLDGGSTDNCGIALLSTNYADDALTAGDITVTLMVEDASGNIGMCDATVTIEVSTPGPIWFMDADNDGFGTDEETVTADECPDGYTSNGEDCDDEDPTSYPGAPGTFSGIDNDCDGEISITEELCAGDLNNDGMINTADLIIMLSNFTCSDGDCIGDITGDGSTSTADLVVLLGKFGSDCAQ